jgi:hypothetical protein
MGQKGEEQGQRAQCPPEIILRGFIYTTFGLGARHMGLMGFWAGPRAPSLPGLAYKPAHRARAQGPPTSFQSPSHRSDITQT